MKDEAIATPPQLSAAESAVLYLLIRIRLDVDLRWHMLDSEAFAKLCAAEAERTGKTPEEVEGIYANPPPECRDKIPELVKLRRLVDAIEGMDDQHNYSEMWKTTLRLIREARS